MNLRNLAWLVIGTSVSLLSPAHVPTYAPDIYVSPDRAILAKVIPSGKEKGNEQAESQLEIRRADGNDSVYRTSHRTTANTDMESTQPSGPLTPTSLSSE